MTANTPTVHVVDDDPVHQETLRALLHGVGLRSIHYASAEDFLDRFPDQSGTPRCVLTDIRLPGMSGLALQQKLLSEGASVSVIFLTAYADVSMIVEAMKGGAFDVLEKPIHRQLILDRVQQLLDQDAEAQYERSMRPEVHQLAEALSARERQVMDLLLEAQNAKQIAANLHISAKTAMKHRARVLDKLGVASVVELMRLVTPPPYRAEFHRQLNER